MPRFLQLGFVFAAVIFLAGCYQASVELFPRGEKLPISGKFTCESKKRSTLAFEEKASGIPFFTRNYRYVEADWAGHMAGAKVADNLWVFQGWEDEKSKNNGAILWVETTDTGVTFLVPNLLGQSAAIDALFKKHKTGQGSGAQLGMLLLRGEPDDLRALVRAHRREHLMPFQTCKKV